MRRLATVAALLLPLVLLPSPARAAAPDAVGWWSAAHRAAVPVTPPPPPDVAAGDLLLQGGDLQRELPDTAPAPTAYAALRYAVPEGGVVTGLALQVAAGAQATDVRAYPAASAWQPVENGAIDDAPSPDLARYAVATLSADGTTLAFPDIGKLMTDDGLLDVVLVPGVGDRVVVHRPTAAALSVALATGPPVTAPPVEPAPGPVEVVPVTAPAPGLPPVTGPLPQVVVPTPTPAAQPQLPAPVAAGSPLVRVAADDARARWVVALEALLVAAFFGLLGQGPLARLGLRTGPAEAAGTERGVGRFRAVREGTAPRL